MEDYLGHRDKKKKDKKPSNDTGRVTSPPSNSMCKIPNPLTVRHEPTTEENQRYTEERDTRHGQLRAAQTLNKITVAGIVIGLGSLIGIIVNFQQSRRAFEADERAWLSPQGMNVMLPYEASHVVIAVDFFNTGKTPAHIEKVVTDYGLGKKDGSINWFQSSIAGEQAVPPNIKTPIVYRIKLPITEEQFKDVIEMRLAVDFKSTISYRDIFGRPHNTEICIAVTGPAESFRAGQIMETCGPTKMD